MSLESVDPSSLALEDARGTAVVLADGREWLLADGGLCNALDEARDRIFESSIASGEADMADIRFAAWKMLQANYRVSVEDGRALVFGADNAALAGAVARALFGPTGKRRSYTAWASSALRANGIDPASLEAEARRDVLHHLVSTGRAMPVADFVDAILEADAMAELRSLVVSGPPVTSGPASG